MVCCGLSLAGLAGLCLVVGVVCGLLCGFLVLVVAAIAVLVWVLCIVLLVSCSDVDLFGFLVCDLL